MEKYERQFQGIWIPKEIWLLKELNCQDKCLLAEIQSLDTGEGCFASNKYFAEFFGISETTVSTTISKLKKLGLVEQISFDGTLRKLKACLKENLKSAFKKTLRPNIYNIEDNIEDNNKLSKDNLLGKKLNKKSCSLLDSKQTRKNKKDILLENLKNNILSKYTMYFSNVVNDLLVKWLNGLYQLNKLPSENSLDLSLADLLNYTEDEIIETINKSIKGDYRTFYPTHNVVISSDGINRNANITDYEKQHQEDSLAIINELFNKPK